MSIRYRPDRKKWEASVLVHGQRKRPLFQSKREAVEFEREFRLGKIGLKREAASPTIDEAFSAYFEQESAQKNPISAKNDRRYLGLTFHFLTVVRRLELLDEVELDDLKALRKWLKNEQRVDHDYKGAWSPATVNRCMATLKVLFSQQVQSGKLKSDPCLYLDNLPIEPIRRRAMTPVEYETIFDAAPEWFRPALSFMRITGARPSSICRLTWEHVDLSKRVLVLKSKKGAKGKVRIIPVPIGNDLFAILVAERNRRPMAAPSDFVFKNEHDEPLAAEWMSKIGNRVIRRCGLRGVSLYGLRHALAVDLTEAGVPTEVVRQALGHSNISTTQRYAQNIHLGVVADAVERVRGKDMPPNATADASGRRTEWQG